VRDGEIALVIGLLLGLGAAFLVDYFDDKVNTKEDVERLTGGVPVLAVIPRIRSWKKSDRVKLITAEEPFSPITESYRAPRTSLQFAGPDAPKTVLVTSALGTEGKMSTVANLGVVLANAAKRVVVGCDLRRPRIDEFLGQPEGPATLTIDASAFHGWVRRAENDLAK
jgi:hypothetical protein